MAERQDILSLQIHGMAEVQEVIRQLEMQLGSDADVGGVELVGKGRDDGGTNHDVIHWLKDGGRDYLSVDGAEKERIAQAFVDEMEQRMLAIAERTNKAVRAAARRGTPSKLGKTTNVEQLKKTVRDAVGGAYKEAMRELQTMTADMLSGNYTADGQPADKVGEAYARKRMRDFGVPDSEVGRASGQLLANVNNPAMIRITKRK